MQPEKKKFEEYRLYIFTFVVLSVLTLLAVGLTRIRFDSPLLIAMIMILAVIQAIIVLLFNMHLKFQDKILVVFAGIIFSLIFLTILVTMLDFAYR